MSDYVRPHRRQAPPSLGFSRQEHWSGLPFPSPMHESESEVAQSCPTPSDPRDFSPPGSSVHGIFQARVLEWGAIAFSVIINASSQQRFSIRQTVRTEDVIITEYLGAGFSSPLHWLAPVPKQRNSTVSYPLANDNYTIHQVLPGPLKST